MSVPQRLSLQRKRKPTAQHARAETQPTASGTSVRFLGVAGARTSDHWRPFQCSMSAEYLPPPENQVPTAQQSRPDTQVAPFSARMTKGACVGGVGVGTARQPAPFQCSTHARVALPASVAPTAQQSCLDAQAVPYGWASTGRIGAGTPTARQPPAAAGEHQAIAASAAAVNPLAMPCTRNLPASRRRRIMTLVISSRKREPHVPPTSQRQAMIASAAMLMRERGVDGTSFSEVLAHSGAPRGSIYHWFPGGKTELIEEATRYAGEYIRRGAAAALAEGGPLSFLDLSESFWTAVLNGSDFSAGCPVVAGTLEGERTPAVRDAAGNVFASWQEDYARNLAAHGVSRGRARSLAATVLAAIEGSVLLCRAQRTIEPLDRTLAELRTLVAGALRDDDSRAAA